MRTDFKVNDKRYYWTKIKAHAAVMDWESLEKFAKEKKPPIGYAPFAETCIEARAFKEADKYTAKISPDQADVKVDLFLQTKNFPEAIEAAKSAKDKQVSFDLLSQIRTKCNTNRELVHVIDQFLSQLSK